MKLIYCLLILLIVSIFPAHAVEDGRWILTISALDKVEFGTEQLAGGLQIEWETSLEFTVVDGSFKYGTGNAALVGEITAFSRPVEMFDCQLKKGTFANKSGQSFSVPHLRYKAFPLKGRVVGESIQLNSYLEYPGNYYAVIYRCQTVNELGSYWIQRSPQIARELSKRQDAITTVKEGTYQADIKEVKSISPGPQIELPLIDGLKFSVTQQYGLRKLEYLLRRRPVN